MLSDLIVMVQPVYLAVSPISIGVAIPVSYVRSRDGCVLYSALRSVYYAS